MAKLGISIKIDVSKVDKARLFKGQKGTYLDLTTFIDTDQVDQYDNNGFISQSVSKEEREQNVQTPILGNCKVFYTDQQQGGYHQAPAPQQQPPRQMPPQGDSRAPQQQPTPAQGFDDFDDSVPF